LTAAAERAGETRLRLRGAAAWRSSSLAPSCAGAAALLLLLLELAALLPRWSCARGEDGGERRAMRAAARTAAPRRGGADMLCALAGKSKAAREGEGEKVASAILPT
jgi:hypothetical protein